MLSEKIKELYTVNAASGGLKWKDPAYGKPGELFWCFQVLILAHVV